MVYPYPQLTAQLRYHVSVEQYQRIVQPILTSSGTLRIFNLGNAYWQAMPCYHYTSCPLCGAAWYELIDSYSLLGWLGVSTTISKSIYRSNGNKNIPENFPALEHCIHYTSDHCFLNLHGRLPIEISYFESGTGEAPHLTGWAMPDDIESYAVLHALPLCRIAAGQFVPSYTLFILTYFSVDPRAIIWRHYTAEAERGKGDPEFYPAGLDWPDVRPEANPYYDLQAWATKGRLGYLDFTDPALPLRIGPNTQLPAIYQQIPGARYTFTWRKGIFETSINQRRASHATLP
ncbi:MAG: hypothetical protein DYG89_27090 [Caldilinea sp. CFX5]|nr:hypothetical protein [Caldilinea sp. CFX5]